MTFLLKVFDELAADEDEVLVNSLYKDYWILPQVSMLFPFWRRSYRLVSIGLFLFHTTALVGHFILLSYSIFLLSLEGNWELISLVAHFTILSIYGMFFVIICNSLRSHVAKQHRLLYNDVGVYNSGRIYAEQMCADLRKCFRLETLYFLTLPAFICFVGCVILGGPYLVKWNKGVEEPYTPNGINLNLPIAVWYPFPTHEGVLHFVALAGQVCGVLSLSIIIFTSLLMMADVTQRLRYEFRIIIYSLNTLFDRSSNLYRLNHPEQEEVKLDDTNFEYQRVLELCLRETLVHHQNLTKMIATFNSEISLLVALGYSTGLLVIGICLYNILVAMVDVNYMSIVIFILMMVAEVCTVFLMSLLGTLLTGESESLRDELYFMEWYNLDMRNKKTVLNFLTAITEPVKIKGVGIIDMNMATFSSVMNSAYSFFNIMKFSGVQAT